MSPNPIVPRLLSVNVGRARTVAWQEEELRTGIFKSPVEGRVRVTTHVDGDEQGNPVSHGGVDKAVYAYPFAHYAYWSEAKIAAALPLGSFGENLTVDGVDENSVRIGDRIRAGSVEFIVRQPRFPCSRLCARFQRADMIDRFLASRRTGFYLAVAQPGELVAGDVWQRLETNPDAPSVHEIADLYATREPEPERLRRAVDTPELAAKLREQFRNRLERRT